MKIGILITSISNFGQKGFYNSQEIGLAKALAQKYDKIEVYKLVLLDQKRYSEKIENCNNATIHFIPSKNWGINGVIDVSVLDSSLNAIIHFSDTQFSVSTVYKWCSLHNVQYIPYIGVVKSHSVYKAKRIVTNLVFKRNLEIYRKSSCCVKTPTVQNELQKLGVHNTVLAPVALDRDLLKYDYEKESIVTLKNKHDYQENDKVLLFVGRLITEKQPIKMIEIFSEISKIDHNYKLMIVGSGMLKDEVKAKIKELDVTDKVRMVEQIPNSDIWELYTLAEAFINLNQQEIFGMAILEAMYYGCKVVAWEAPGPNFIIEEGVSGYIVNSVDQVIDRVFNTNQFKCAAHNRISEHFVWERTAEKISSVIRDE